MDAISRIVLRAAAAGIVLTALSMAPVHAVSDNTIGDNVIENRGIGLVLMTSIKRNR